MFSGNDRISGRQVFRLLTYDLLGLSTLLVPTVLGRVAGTDGIFCIGIGAAAGLLYLKVLGVLVADIKTTFLCYLEERLGIILGKVIQACYYLYFILLAGYTAYLFVDVVLDDLLREESFYLVLSVLMVLAAYGLWGGIEGRARVYEMVFWFIMLPLFLMLLFALDEVLPDYWSPVFMTDARGIFAGSYYVFGCFAIVCLVLFLGEYVEKRSALLKASRWAIIFAGGIHGVLYLILLGIFGARSLGTMEYPAVILMSTVKISGGFLKRTDAFMFAVWFFTLYALLNSCIFYAGKILMQLAETLLGQVKAKKRTLITSGVSLLLVYGIACCFYKSKASLDHYEQFLWYIGTPFLIAMPLILVLIKRAFGGKERNCKAKHIGAAVVILFAGNVMTGCSTAELEDRNFPIEIAVEDTADFTEGFLDVQSTGNRMVDYSHLKVMILSEDFVEDAAAMQELLALLEEKNELPRNTYVVVAQDPQEILAMQESLGESAGDYLEEQFENVSKVRKQAYPTLGMLYQEDENQMETLFIPYVSKDEQTLVIDRYYVWKRGEASGQISKAAALLAYFTENDMEEYKLFLEDGAVISLFDAHNQVDFVEQGGKRRIVVRVNCSGRLLSGRMAAKEDWENEMLADEIAQYLNDIAEKVRMEQQVDVTGSYRKLGGVRRDWYLEYQKDDTDYEWDMDILYDVHIDWINL